MSSDIDIIQINEVLNGNARAFRIIVNRHKHNVLNIVGRIIGDSMEAEEVAQDVFIKAYNKLGMFKAEAKFSTWLYRIAYNHAISTHRKQQPHNIPLDETEVDHEVEFFNNAEDMEAIRQEHLPKALEMLPAEDQALLSMYYQQDLSIRDISLITSLSESNVKIRLYRSRKCLHEIMSERIKTLKLEARGQE